MEVTFFPFTRVHGHDAQRNNRQTLTERVRERDKKTLYSLFALAKKRRVHSHLIRGAKQAGRGSDGKMATHLYILGLYLLLMPWFRMVEADEGVK